MAKNLIGAGSLPAKSVWTENNSGGERMRTPNGFKDIRNGFGGIFPTSDWENPPIPTKSGSPRLQRIFQLRRQNYQFSGSQFQKKIQIIICLQELRDLIYKIFF
jgi:hypothetical protein